MKKTTLLSLICTIVVSFETAAQSDAEKMEYMRDSYIWSVNDYYGTAHTMGMANAVTALGGDLGSIAINPAGSAVAPYIQAAVTPGVSISTNDTQGTMTADKNTYLGDNVKNTTARFMFPNGGFSFNFDTGNIRGLKRVSFGFVANAADNFNDNVRAVGRSRSSTYAGYLANQAQNGRWNDVVNLAYDKSVIRKDGNVNPVDPTETDPQKIFGYVGVTEWPNPNKTASMRDGTTLDQTFTQKTYGSKTDFIINLGFNISDIIFLGANLGIQSLNYNMYEILTESASINSGSESQFYNGFSNLNQTYSYQCSGVGIYGRFGIIATPVAGLRIGATIQTPTRTTINEHWGYSISNQFQNSTLSGNTPGGSWKCILTSPFRFSFGAAYTFKDKGIISVDYERVNYGQSKYSACYIADEAYCTNLNTAIAGESRDGACLGGSNIVRVGAEFKPISIIAIRAGYNLVTSGEYAYEKGELKNLKTDTQQVCCGLGYDSPGSFFCDVAFRYSWIPSKQINVYGTYGNRGLIDEKTYEETCGPVVMSKRALMGVAATIGWRF